MQRLKFLSKNDFTALDMMIQEKIANWSRDWVFTTAFDLVIEEITFADHIEKDAKILSIIGHSDHELLLIERKFSWGRFIFNEEFEGCPEDSVMYSVSRAVERSFWSEVFNLDASSSEEVSTAAPRPNHVSA